MTHPPTDGRTLIDQLLEEQSRLTAVEAFSGRHDRGELPRDQRRYQDRIPLVPPAAGEQYAFEVDLDACTGCKACVTACHSLNGLDDGETWRSTGVLIGGPQRRPVQQIVTTACHHCVDPGCLSGCPVEAYEKDPATGIVRHLDDQCIGCEYCLWKCPYEVPRYSPERGIIRKCDMCHGRLAAGEAPACVQACPNGAITIATVTREQVIARAAERFGLPDSPPAGTTLPATRYRSARPWPADMRAMDHFDLRPQPAQWPLVAMLVLTQLALGLATLAAVTSAIRPALAGPWLAATTAIVLLAGMGTSVAHLGRPSGAWRCFLGWRTSWLSREVLAFGVWAIVALAATIAAATLPAHAALRTGAQIASVAAGALAVFCSAMVYADTRREFWSLERTAGRFFATAALLGASTGFAATGLADGWARLREPLAVATLVAGFLALAAELRALRGQTVDLNSVRLAPLERSAWLLAGPLGLLARGRIAVLLLGSVLLPAADLLTGTAATPWVPLLAASLSLVSETGGRHLFFIAASPHRMPGNA